MCMSTETRPSNQASQSPARLLGPLDAQCASHPDKSTDTFTCSTLDTKDPNEFHQAVGVELGHLENATRLDRPHAIVCKLRQQPQSRSLVARTCTFDAHPGALLFGLDGGDLQRHVCLVGFYFRLDSIPNVADPMVEWLVVFLCARPVTRLLLTARDVSLVRCRPNLTLLPRLSTNRASNWHIPRLATRNSWASSSQQVNLVQLFTAKSPIANFSIYHFDLSLRNSSTDASWQSAIYSKVFMTTGLQESRRAQETSSVARHQP